MTLKLQQTPLLVALLRLATTTKEPFTLLANSRVRA